MTHQANKQIIAIVYKMREKQNKANEFVEVQTDAMAKDVLDIENVNQDATIAEKRKRGLAGNISPVPNA